jgi:plastocyanin
MNSRQHRRSNNVMGLVAIASVAGIFTLGISPAPATPPQFQITIESVSPYYLPASATVTTGAPVRWDNPTPSHHTVTHDGCITGGSCMFDSGSVAPNSSYMVPGLPPGRYPYHCSLHPIMRGVLIVIEPISVSSQA